MNFAYRIVVYGCCGSLLGVSRHCHEWHLAVGDRREHQAGGEAAPVADGVISNGKGRLQSNDTGLFTISKAYGDAK